MTDDQITALSRAIDPFSYARIDTAGARTSGPEPIPRQVLDTSEADEIARIHADIDAAEKHLIVVLATMLPIAVALLTFPLWS
jgi:hypothetical protein